MYTDEGVPNASLGWYVALPVGMIAGGKGLGMPRVSRRRMDY